MNKSVERCISFVMECLYLACICWHFMTGSDTAENIFVFYSYVTSICGILVVFIPPKGERPFLALRWFHGLSTAFSIFYAAAFGWFFLASVMVIGLLCSLSRCMKCDEEWKKLNGNPEPLAPKKAVPDAYIYFGDGSGQSDKNRS